MVTWLMTAVVFGASSQPASRLTAAVPHPTETTLYAVPSRTCRSDLHGRPLWRSRLAGPVPVVSVSVLGSSEAVSVLVSVLGSVLVLVLASSSAAHTQSRLFAPGFVASNTSHCRSCHGL